MLRRYQVTERELAKRRWGGPRGGGTDMVPSQSRCCDLAPVETEPKNEHALATPPADRSAGSDEERVLIDFAAIADAVPQFESRIAEAVARFSATAPDTEPRSTSLPAVSANRPGVRGEAPANAPQSRSFQRGLWVGLFLGVAASGFASWWMFALPRSGPADAVAVNDAVEAEAAQPLQPAELAADATDVEAEIRGGSTADPSDRVPDAPPSEPNARSAAVASPLAQGEEGIGEAASEPARAADTTDARGSRPISSRVPAGSPGTTAAVPETSAGSRSMETLLDQALGGQPTEEPPPAPPVRAPDPELPETPSRSNVAQTLGRLLGPMRLCAADKVGVATAAISLESSGRVVSVSVSGAPFGGSREGACMESVIRRARFEPFQRARFDVSYPFSIQPRL